MNAAENIKETIRKATWHQQVASVGVEDLRALLNEREQLAAQVAALQADASAKADASLARQVRAFHFKFGHPVEWQPRVPADAQVLFRLTLIAEEFVELLEAGLAIDEEVLSKLKGCLQFILAVPQSTPRACGGVVAVDLPELVDALADLDYVIEGTRAVFGVHAAPIAAAVHAANMAKDAVQVAEADEAKRGTRIKPLKPAGWSPPDVAGLLRAQGWSPESEIEVHADTAAALEEA